MVASVTRRPSGLRWKWSQTLAVWSLWLGRARVGYVYRTHLHGLWGACDRYEVLTVGSLSECAHCLADSVPRPPS